MSEYLQKMQNRKAKFNEHSSHFEKCALILMHEDHPLKADLEAALTDAGIQFESLETVMESADPTTLPRVHIGLVHSELDADFKTPGKPGYIVDGVLTSTPTPDDVPDIGLFVYRHLYVFESKQTNPVLCRVLRDRTRDMNAFTLVDIVANHHALSEIARLEESEEEPA